MNERRLSYRRKGKSIILEGRLPNGKPLGIWTLPEANKFILQIIENASFLPKEKQEQIKQKYLRLGYKLNTDNKPTPEVRLLNIKRTTKKDAISDDQSKALWEMTK